MKRIKKCTLLPAKHNNQYKDISGQNYSGRTDF